MTSISAPRVGFPTSALFAAMLLTVAAAAQPAPAPPEPAANDPDRNSPAYLASVDTRIVLRADLTAAVDRTVRYKVLRESAIRMLGQQSLSYSESVNPLEVVEAYTEKSDGRKIVVEPSHILTRDAATGLNAV